MDDQIKVENKLESCRIGRNCEARFWCGFCQTTIEIKKPGYSAWGERFDHIDDHFTGRNQLDRKTISDWKNVDPSDPTSSSSPNESNEMSAESSKRFKKQRKGSAEAGDRAPKRQRMHHHLTYQCVSSWTIVHVAQRIELLMRTRSVDVAISCQTRIGYALTSPANTISVTIALLIKLPSRRCQTRVPTRPCLTGVVMLGLPD